MRKNSNATTVNKILCCPHCGNTNFTMELDTRVTIKLEEVDGVLKAGVSDSALNIDSARLIICKRCKYQVGNCIDDLYALMRDKTTTSD